MPRLYILYSRQLPILKVHFNFYSERYARRATSVSRCYWKFISMCWIVCLSFWTRKSNLFWFNRVLLLLLSLSRKNLSQISRLMHAWFLTFEKHEMWFYQLKFVLKHIFNLTTCDIQIATFLFSGRFIRMFRCSLILST